MEEKSKGNEVNEDTASQEDTDKKSGDPNSSGKQFKEILDGTARLGRSIGEAFKGVADVFRGRDHVVMVRVNKQSLDRIDELVQSGLFKSRSESSAFLIAMGIEANAEIYVRIKDKVGQINKLKDELQTIIGTAEE